MVRTGNSIRMEIWRKKAAANTEFCVINRYFNSAGQVTATEEIDPNGANFELLERYRAEHRWDPEWSEPTD
jgi:hypothetical protein